MPYAPLYSVGAPEEVPGQVLANLAGTLGMLNSGAFDRMTAGQRCQAIWRLVMALIGIDLYWLARHPETPFLYHSGVRYRMQQTLNGAPLSSDLWLNIPAILQHGEGSCEDLAAWRVAELRFFGQTDYERAARPYVHSRQDGQTTVYHVVVRYPDEQEEDPSALLGMPAGAF